MNKYRVRIKEDAGTEWDGHWGVIYKHVDDKYFVGIWGVKDFMWEFKRNQFDYEEGEYK